MNLRSQLSKVRREIVCSMHRRTIALGDLGPIVTFSFDDFPRSALTRGADIIEGFGGRATYYVSMGLMGNSNDLGEQFDSADLLALVERGHDVASHTFGHLSARTTQFEEFLKDVNRGEHAIQDWIDFETANNFAYPYGDVTVSVKKQLGPRMKSCRGTFGGLNGPDVDLNLLRANRLYGGIDQSEVAKRLIVENEKRRSWLLFYSHDVADNPSRFGCTPALLEEIVSFSADHGSKIMTVAGVINKLCAAG
jgi:peptidoglycan/xylan/chitin deacetylase (PgdA/CDA1 family)